MAGRLTTIIAGISVAGLSLLVAPPASAAPNAGFGHQGIAPVETEPPDVLDNPLAQYAMPPIPSFGEVMGGGQSSELTEPGSGAIAPEGAPTVEYDLSKLPPAVQAIRERIVEAAKSGDPARLRPVIDASGDMPDFGDAAAADDPVAYLKSVSGDAEGREILAILLEVLDAGFVHVDAGTPEEMYVWPYFARYPMEKLTPPQVVELFKLIYAGDWEDMKNEGHYLFYRVGIDPSGKWRYFTAGD